MEVEKVKEIIGADISTLPEEIKTKVITYVEGAEAIRVQLPALTEAQKKLQSDLEYQKAESAKAFAKRDEVKAEHTALKKQVEELGGASAIDLYKTETKKREEAEARAQKLQDEKTEVETRLKGLTEKQKSDLLSKLPEGSEQRKFAETLELDKLQQLVSAFSIGNDWKPDGGKGGQTKIIAGKTWTQYSAKDLDDIEKSNPEVYAQLRDQFAITGK